MKITYYSKYSNLGPSSRYRAFQYKDLLRSAGFDFQISELLTDRYFEILRQPEPLSTLQKIPYTISRFKERKRAIKQNNSDLAIVEHQLFPYIPFTIEKMWLPKRFLLEFDDAIYLTHTSKIPQLIRAASGVIVGNETLAEYARRFSNNIHVIPTALDTAHFSPSPKPSREKVVIGWSGLEYNFHYLQLLAPVLRKVIQRLPVQIQILSGSPPVELDLDFRFVKWHPGKEVEQLNEFDIGLMPLQMDEWSKGKCGFKLLQYMSLEIASVASPVGVNEKIVRHGINGFLAQELSAWEAHLTELVSNPDLRTRLGKAARSTVLDDYSTDVWFPQIAALYRSYA